MRRSLVLAGLCLLAACSSLQVQTDYSEDVDFSTFETFKYRDSDENAADSNPLVHERIVDAINAAFKVGVGAPTRWLFGGNGGLAKMMQDGTDAVSDVL